MFHKYFCPELDQNKITCCNILQKSILNIFGQSPHVIKDEVLCRLLKTILADAYISLYKYIVFEVKSKENTMQNLWRQREKFIAYSLIPLLVNVFRNNSSTRCTSSSIMFMRLNF